MIKIDLIFPFLGWCAGARRPDPLRALEGTIFGPSGEGTATLHNVPLVRARLMSANLRRLQELEKRANTRLLALRANHVPGHTETSPSRHSREQEMWRMNL